ncbi:MAG: quinohemoprotein ethanol dehydrogenase [Woeseiaceae bacterium]|jgi:quinohemoprotein ethanol dehydrogenase
MGTCSGNSLLTLCCAAIVIGGCQRDEPAVSADPQADVPAVETAVAWVDTQRLEHADAEPQNWFAHGRTWSEQRYSPLEQIDDSNVGELGLAWYFDLDTSRGQQASPIVVDGWMYTTSAWSKVQALHAKTGQLIWQYDPEVPKEWDAKSCCGVQNRGAAVWKGRVFVGTIDGRLIALDADTGELEWSVQTTDRTDNYSITGAPRVVNDLVIIGNGGAEYNVRGYVTAYSAETGEQVWRFWAVPGNPEDGFESEAMEMAAETWTGEWWKFGGGGTAWDSFAYDPELNLFYIGTGNGSPWPRTLRSPGGGDNLFLCSIVAVNADTGEYVWHYQTVPGDTWDYTSVQHMILADLEIDGRERKVIMQAPKNGFFYVIDRETGEFISAENIMPVNWATHIDQETGRPVEAPGARYDEVGIAKKISPGPGGAHNWQPMSFSPDTGLVYLPAKQEPEIYRLDEEFQARSIGTNFGVDFWNSYGEVADLPPEFGEEFQGYLLAWNPVTQKEVWRATHSTFHNGGVLSTAGNLVFQGNIDENIAAYNATTGETLWSMNTQTAMLAPPVSFSIDGEQYIAVVVGYGSSSALWASSELNPEGTKRNISRVLAFKLGGDVQLPEMPPLPVRPPPTDDFGSEAQIQAGAVLFGRSCGGCHGSKAIGNALNPDLRYSPISADAAAWKSVVIDGSLSANGMISFAELYGEDDAEALRAYVVNQAHQQVE